MVAPAIGSFPGAGDIDRAERAGSRIRSIADDIDAERFLRVSDDLGLVAAGRDLTCRQVHRCAIRGADMDDGPEQVAIAAVWITRFDGHRN